jgi:L-ribulose-5-phosphate 3-epimerase
MNTKIDRRRFLVAGVVAALTAETTLSAAEKKPARLRKAVKFDMIKIKAPIRDKFELIKSLGFQGVEMDSPSKINKDEAVKARDDTGIVIHGVIDSIHWNVRLSDPDPEVRAKGLKGLQTALEEAKIYGADTALLVPGKVSNPETENFDQVWSRSQAEVRKALPLAEKLGVKIAIEVVWNDFITTPDQLVKYVDEFQSPYVGAYFDCSNMIKYGVKSGDWIRKLGKRMLKFDFKGFSKTRFDKKQKPWWVPIGEGDEDWPDVLKALEEIGYTGWATAEVAGGGPKELKDVAERMNRCLGLA